MRALITGASGFVGRHLIDLLTADGDWSLVGTRSHAGPPIGGIQTVACDLLDAARVRDVASRFRPEVVFHLAALTHVPEAFADPARTIATNATAQINLLEACRAAGLTPLVLIAGSSEVYGSAQPGSMPLDEDAPFRPANPYAVSKVTQDMLGLQYFLSYGMRIIRARPFNHVGPGQSDRFVVSTFARQIVAAERGQAEPVIRVGNLDAERDFLDVRDVVRAYRLLVERGVPGEAYNVASGTPRSVRSVLDCLLAQATLPIRVERDPNRMRPADAPTVYGDAGKLRRVTGWAPVIPFEQSLADTLAYWRAQG